MIYVTCKVKVYEMRGESTAEMEGKDIPSFLVISHWNEKNKVVFSVGGQTVTVIADDVIAAIKNATNSNRF